MDDLRADVTKDLDTMTATHVDHLDAIVAAIEAIGLPVRWGKVTQEGLLPGIRIENGGLTIDTETLLFAGDVLHEAGHLAVLTPEERATVAGTLPKEGGAEMAALAWSYAMAIEFDLPLDVVFHDAFKAGGSWLRETFAAGHPLGQPLLQFWEMTRTSEDIPGFEHLPRYPKMALWLRP